MSVQGKLSTYPIQELAPIICEFLSQGKNVIVPARGNSMRPLVRNERDNIVLTAYKGERLNVGDAVFYRRQGGAYVLHRIVDVDEDGRFTLMGDNQSVPEKRIRAEQIIALPVAFIRGNKTVSCDSVVYKRYVKFWTGSVFFRKLHQKLFYLTIKIKSKIKRIFMGV